MQVEFDHLDVLADIQAIDLAVMKAKKARGELPQRIEVMKVRKKRDEITPKLEKVIAMQDGVQAEVTEVEDEDRGLAEKQERAQQDIANAGSDYRKVESHSKDMAGIAKRRADLGTRLAELNEELAKIRDARGKLEGAIALCEAREAELRAEFQADDDKLIADIRELMAKRSELAAGLPADLMKLYDDTAAKTGGVALGKLADGKCGVCRATIDGGRLIELRAQAPLGTCPNCKRLLIVED